ncbi:MAG: helix-turn-helix domain-containing protein [Firmicutes bacterium]|nr:helix-turn-helix domain-containing protein [Bacillota bacterium]
MANKLKEIRIDKGFTQTDIAKKLNMSPNGYCNYENGVRDVPTKVLIKLAQIYNVTVGQLLGVEDYYD